MTLPFKFEVVTEIRDDKDEYVYVFDEELESNDKSEISLCTLSAINWGLIKDPRDFEKPCDLAVRALDELLDYQEYPILAAQLSTMNRRPLGIGIINLAYWLAKNDLTYQHIDNNGLSKVHEYAEAWSYYLIKASVDLAKEKGACPKSDETRYSLGIMPIDTYKRDVDELTAPVYKMDWESLREEAKAFGIRNSTLMALMPSECQSLENEIVMKDGSIVTLETLLKEHAKIDINAVHEGQMVGQRFQFLKPIELANSVAYECYYNGPRNTTEIEFEDGKTYRFTDDHLLLVDRNGQKLWVKVSDLTEDDNVISVNDK
jgi:hypothetical protein